MSVYLSRQQINALQNSRLESDLDRFRPSDKGISAAKGMVLGSALSALLWASIGAALLIA